MTELMQCHNQWKNRPADERFTSLPEMQQAAQIMKSRGKELVVPSREIEFFSAENDLWVSLPSGGHMMTHHAFSQIAKLADFPAGSLRELPPHLAAQVLNYKLMDALPSKDIGILTFEPETSPRLVRAQTGPKYGRVFNADIIQSLIDRFGDGITGDFRVPGEFGKAVTVTKDNTTLFMNDQGLFIFLADEVNRIEIPDRRNGQPGSLARGFFIKHSEVGTSKIILTHFLFDYVCCNRIVWGARDVVEVAVVHNANAPQKWLDEVKPTIDKLHSSSPQPIIQAITDARDDRLGEPEDVTKFLANLVGVKRADQVRMAHLEIEERPIETRWDAIVGITQFAQDFQNTDVRLEFEQKAAELLPIAA